jgi:hypothetical protein
MKAETWLRGLRGDIDLHRISTPIKVEKEERIQVLNTIGGKKKQIDVLQFDFSFIFRGTDGKDMRSSGRLFVPTKRPLERLPMVVSMHYEMDANASAQFLARGWATMTPFGERSYKVPNLMGHGINHSICMARLPRRMPFVDQRHLILTGASAGGFHALIASSMIFPVTAVYAAVPLLNLKYNIKYLLRNDGLNINPENPDKPPAPIVKMVMTIANETAKGGRPDAQSWRPFSPVFQRKFMTFPTFITYSTADVLVPINQLSSDLVQNCPPGHWPEGYTFELPNIAPYNERDVFLSVLKPLEYKLKVVKISRDSPTIVRNRDEMTPAEAAKIFKVTAQWSKVKRFSIMVFDEGYPEPFCGHTKYHFDLEDDFYEYHMSQKSLRTEILTREKLAQIMMRLSAREENQGMEYEDGGSWHITRLDLNYLERWYAARGLEIYMRGSKRNANHAVRLYGELPAKLRVLDFGSSKFDRDPFVVLLHHQNLAAELSGDKS